jgi:hypothetical protein
MVLRLRNFVSIELIGGLRCENAATTQNAFFSIHPDCSLFFFCPGRGSSSPEMTTNVPEESSNAGADE